MKSTVVILVVAACVSVACKPRDYNNESEAQGLKETFNEAACVKSEENPEENLSKSKAEEGFRLLKEAKEIVIYSKSPIHTAGPAFVYLPNLAIKKATRCWYNLSISQDGKETVLSLPQLYIPHQTEKNTFEPLSARMDSGGIPSALKIVRNEKGLQLILANVPQFSR